MSLFESLNVATRGLSAAQIGISVTGQNITNASTEGYSRKRIEQSAEWKRESSYGQMGFGVEVYSINRIRDQFVDRLVNDESTRYGFYSIKDKAYNRIEDIFQEPEKHALNGLLKDFWNGWADLANSPESAGTREALRTTSQSLVGQFQYISTQLRSYKDTINDEIESRVEKINEMATAINRCNLVITSTENTIGHKANDTRDQRDQLVEDLAKLIDVDYYEDENGALIVSTNGNMLVSLAKSHEIVIQRMQITGPDGYQYARVELSFELTGKEYKPKQGELRALMDVRDEDIPKYEEYINEVAKTLITEVNKIHQNGYALSGLTFIDFFDSDPSKLNAANMDLSAAVKSNINHIATGSGGKRTAAVGFKISDNWDVPNVNPGDTFRLADFVPNSSDPKYANIADQNYLDQLYKHIDSNSIRITADGYPNPLVEGTDYNIVDRSYPDPFNPVVIISTKEIEFITATPLTNVSIGFSYDTSKFMVPQLSSPDDSHMLDLMKIDEHYRFICKDSLEIKDANGNLLQEGKDYDVDYTTAQITFRYSATNAFGDINNPVSISFDYHASGYAGPGDADVAHLISQLRDKSVLQNDAFGKSTQTINEFYAGMLGRLGTERNEAGAGLETRVSALQALKVRQDEIMGVSLNEEMASLIQYEHTYQASARFLTTVDTMIDILLNM